MKKYVIINASEIDSVDFNKVLVTSSETARRNNDNTKEIIKYEGNQPSFLDGKQEYTHSEIRSIVTDVNGEWFTPLQEE